MCSRLIKINGESFACRKCNDCIKARKNGWVARAMAEKAMSKETYSITLTYNDETQENRDGARSFEYRHVRLFLSRLRKEIFDRTGQTSQIRFICAGEIGSDKGRCHYHLILYCQTDIFKYGEFTAWPSGRAVPERWQKITVGKKKRRLNWSMWPHGFVTFQEPDQWGMEYALVYALKDQFNVVASQGTMREAKAQTHASGLFRMSKRPPIGQTFLDQKLNGLEERLQVPVNLNIKVPNYKGYWYPDRNQRDYMIDRIKLINQLHVAKHGKNAPQWGSLVQSVINHERDWERLTSVTETEEEEYAEEVEGFKLDILLRTKEIRAAQLDRDTRKRCGSIVACQRCVNSLTEKEFAEATTWTRRQTEAYGGFDAANEAFRNENRPNPYCNYRELPLQKRAFKK